MSDQAAGLRAWQRQRDRWPLLVLGEPRRGALESLLSALNERSGRRWAPVTLAEAPRAAPGHALLWIETRPVDATLDYRWLKRMAVDVGPLPTLLHLESAAISQARLDNLSVAARRFLGVELSHDPGRWLAP